MEPGTTVKGKDVEIGCIYQFNNEILLVIFEFNKELMQKKKLVKIGQSGSWSAGSVLYSIFWPDFSFHTENKHIQMPDDLLDQNFIYLGKIPPLN